ncbi:PilN domain-containing protein [Halalkalibacillus halophilus]|uniref:PilN domain-containing protein n=1 Tax=Halalkalibacillus halophilus TaxID=392827 RepID=UPI000411E74A|nr:PilN domain-containing protein [Halalkalibacillus halophilus]
MLIDINLLPVKEKKNNHPKILFSILGFLSVLVLVTVAFFFWEYEQDRSFLSERLNQEQALTTELQSELSGDEEFQEAERLEAITTDIQEAIPEATPVLEELLENLPSRSHVEAYQTDQQTVELTVRTSSNIAAVTYFQSLREIEELLDVDIHSISYMDDEEYFVTTYTVHLQEEEEQV